MDITLLLVRLLIASVFLIAAVAKVADLRGTRDAVVAFGVPTGLAIPVGVALPLAEFAVAAALVVHDWAYAGALGAIGLLLAFCVGIGWNLARGQAPECHCFGQLHSATISWITLARNGALAAAAGVVLSMGRDDPGASAIGWIQGLSITEHIALVGSLVVGAALLAQGRLIRHVLEQNGLLVTRLELLESILTPGPETTDSATSSDHRRAPLPVGLPVGAIAPRFELSDLDGSRHTLTGLCERGKPVVLVFSDPNCGPCTALLPEIGTWQRKYGEQISLVVISRGSQDANRQRAITHGITPLLIQHDREVADAFQVLGTPSAVIVTPDGTIGSHLASGSGAIAALVSRSAIPDVGPNTYPPIPDQRAN